MIELMTKDGRPVKLCRKPADAWVTIEFISTRGRDVSWRVPDDAVAEFLEGLAVPIADCTVGGIEEELDAPISECTGADCEICAAVVRVRPDLGRWWAKPKARLDAAQRRADLRAAVDRTEELQHMVHVF